MNNDPSFEVIEPTSEDVSILLDEFDRDPHPVMKFISCIGFGFKKIDRPLKSL